MFIKNKYYCWYYSIIEKTKNRILNNDEYYEKHHVIPKSLNGSDEDDNIVKLTAREHFICHLLLIKFTEKPYHFKMVYAANLMASASRDYQDRYTPSSRIYSLIRKEWANAHSLNLTGRKLSEEHKIKIGLASKGRKNSEETIEKRRINCIGKKRTQEQKERMRQAQLNRKEKTEEEKRLYSENMSKAKKGKPKGLMSEETKNKLSLALKGRLRGPLTEETKIKMRKSKSPEHRKNISEARKKKYQQQSVKKIR